jgi:hypothetical protein
MVVSTKYCQIAAIAPLFHCCIVEFPTIRIEQTAIFRDLQLTTLCEMFSCFVLLCWFIIFDLMMQRLELVHLLRKTICGISMWWSLARLSLLMKVVMTLTTWFYTLKCVLVFIFDRNGILIILGLLSKCIIIVFYKRFFSIMQTCFGNDSERKLLLFVAMIFLIHCFFISSWT